MIESIKNKIDGLLRQKEVSLAMIYDREGRILWSRGRTISGRTIFEGSGFPKSDIEKTLDLSGRLTKEDVIISTFGEGLPKSARLLYVKSLLILPVNPRFFLYVDSGVREAFSQTDIEVLTVVGELLGDMIGHIQKSGQEKGGLTGTSQAIQQIRNLVLTYSIEEEPVLLIGETGTGKNHIANLIHRFSGRKGDFVQVHTPSIPENLLESEIFGHKKGAFTGADRDRPGLVEAARAGTIFFDEIAEVPLSFQAKLLQFLDTYTYRVVGDPREYKADTRIVAATNRNLLQEMKNKTFREDLYYRLNVLPIEIPPLRTRKQDIRGLVQEHQDFLRGKTVTSGFWTALERYDWPGNVRELLHVLKRVGIQCSGATLGDEVERIICGPIETTEPAGQTVLTGIVRDIAGGKSFWDTAWRAFLDREISRPEIKSLLRQWFLDHNRNLTSMSQHLGIERKDYPRFISTLHKYHIHPDK
ncbi:sigma-54-dependent Fis family transcriptional regulator [bacterium]|nr:sigma-54-dependent Fis family transcriptional regulator [bacterium]